MYVMLDLDYQLVTSKFVTYIRILLKYPFMKFYKFITQ
jgi:hypothetical protein